MCKILLLINLFCGVSFSQNINEYEGIDYPYSEEPNQVFYGGMNVTIDEIQYQNKANNNNMCITFSLMFDDSVTFTINNIVIYQGRISDNSKYFIFNKDKFKSNMILTMYSHLNKSKSEVILDKRANSVSLSWEKYDIVTPIDYQGPKPFYWNIYYYYAVCTPPTED